MALAAREAPKGGRSSFLFGISFGFGGFFFFMPILVSTPIFLVALISLRFLLFHFDRVGWFDMFSFYFDWFIAFVWPFYILLLAFWWFVYWLVTFLLKTAFCNIYVLGSFQTSNIICGHVANVIRSF